MLSGKRILTLKWKGLGKNLLRSDEIFEALLYCLLFPWYHVCFEKKDTEVFLGVLGLGEFEYRG